MLSIFKIVEIRWAIVITVMPLQSSDMVLCSSEAVWVSTLAVHSSKQRTWKFIRVSHICSLWKLLSPYWNQPHVLYVLKIQENVNCFFIFFTTGYIGIVRLLILKLFIGHSRMGLLLSPYWNQPHVLHWDCFFIKKCALFLYILGMIWYPSL